MKPEKEITIYDIAKKLKVSASTVSRALNDHFSISQETIATVKNLADEWGYRPNNVAASLRKSKTNTIGVMISLINRPFISSLISGVEEEANRSGYNVIISQSQDRYLKEIANAKALYDMRVSGLVVSLSMETQDYKHFQMFQRNGIPIVFVDRIAEELDTYRVTIDNYGSAYRATKHLIDKGAKRIAHFAGSPLRNVYRDREMGYIQALTDHNLVVEESLIKRCASLTYEEGIEMTRQLMALEFRPDAIFSANDTAAIGAITYAKSQKIAIPDRKSVV